jgi:UPF0755 protein
VFVYIPTNSSYEEVKKILEPFVENQEKIDFVAEKRGYKDHVKPGKFLLKKGMGSFSIVRALGLNVPVKLNIQNQERFEDVLAKLDKELEPSATQLEAVFKDDAFLQKYGLTRDNLLSFFLPNSYEYYWNISAEELAEKLGKEYKRFWNFDREAKAKSMNMSFAQVYTLASIVNKESAKVDERPTIAGVYINRLKADMPLQADPTVIYAVKKEKNDWNLVIKRVMNEHTRLNSAYNTYRVKGLPPGPIFMPDVTAIDAVLSPVNHNYLFFCASVEKFGYHEFAENYEQHQVIAKKYSDWVSKQGY